MAPVLSELRRRAVRFHSSVCVTGQHREMLDQVLDLFEIVPDYDLDVMRPEQTLTEIVASVLEGLDRLLEDERPDWVLVQGDTTTTMAAALAAFHRSIPIAHIEAGLRTGNVLEPMPEEMNRRVTAVLTDIHFAPTHLAAANLRMEGVRPDRIVVTGNTVVDAFGAVSLTPFVPSGLLAEISLDKCRIVLATVHRRENHGAAIKQICSAIRSIAGECDDVHIVVPVHLNPTVQQPVYSMLGGVSNITLVPPLDYRTFVWLLSEAYLVLTDSGGLQEEAVAVGKPVLVLRNSTERVEGIHSGAARLVGTDPVAIVDQTLGLLNDDAAYAAMTGSMNPYGDGRAAVRIANTLEELRGRRASVVPADYRLMAR